MDATDRLRSTTERRISEPELDLLRRLFPRGFAGLVPDGRSRFLGVCALVGAAAALAAIGFRLALRGTQVLFFGQDALTGDLLAAAQELPAWQRRVLPAVGSAASAALAAVISRRSGGGGVAGIME